MKLSPVQKRAERQGRNRSLVDLNLVSLIDIFTILIFFLLANASEVEVLPSAKAVRLPESTGVTCAPSMRIRATFSAWRAMSSVPMYTTHSRPRCAATVAQATPCCPAPVSAMMRGLPIFTASNPWPMALLILCAPVCSRSSRFR